VPYEAGKDSSARILRLPASAIPELAPRDWRDALEHLLRREGRVLTMFGAPNEDRITVTAIVEHAGMAPTALRTVVERGIGYHALTSEFPSLHCFERELHEQHGVRIAGHPWLKPIRFETTGPKGRDAYPFYEIHGKEVHEVAVGPIHAGVIEPGAFRFMCLGEQVHHLEIHLGYQHRGVEKLLLGRDPRMLAPLVETIAGDTSIAHTWAYAAAIEALSDTPITRDVDAARGMMLELERVGMHLAGLAGLAADLGFLQGASTYGRLRTTAINSSMRLCGSRFGRGAIRPGGIGVRLDPRADLASTASAVFTPSELRRNLSLIAEDVATIDERFLSARTVQHRLQGVGTVPTTLARDIGLVGLAARASGIPCDLRTRAGGVYERHPMEACVEATGDCWARARVRIGEIGRSLAWLTSVVDAQPSVKPSRPRIGALAPRTLVVAMVEGWRGEVVHAIETDGDGALTRYKVQDPSFRNWLGLALAVRENEISDFPICNKSFDLSYCGNDL
jgi:Ni,Fe-hydrogenase III large subunit